MLVSVSGRVMEHQERRQVKMQYVSVLSDSPHEEEMHRLHVAELKANLYEKAFQPPAKQWNKRWALLVESLHHSMLRGVEDEHRTMLTHIQQSLLEQDRIASDVLDALLHAILQASFTSTFTVHNLLDQPDFKALVEKITGPPGADSNPLKRSKTLEMTVVRSLKRLSDKGHVLSRDSSIHSYELLSVNQDLLASIQTIFDEYKDAGALRAEFLTACIQRLPAIHGKDWNPYSNVSKPTILQALRTLSELGIVYEDGWESYKSV
jgi:DNA-binding transcriptional ArsR family regulator